MREEESREGLRGRSLTQYIVTNLVRFMAETHLAIHKDMTHALTVLLHHKGKAIPTRVDAVNIIPRIQVYDNTPHVNPS